MNAPALPFSSLLRAVRRRAWWQAWLNAAGGGVLVAGALYAWLGIPGLGAGGLTVLVLLGWQRSRETALRINSSGLADHLNRCLPELEESASLWLVDPSTLDVLERLQRARIEPAWQSIATEQTRWLPPIRFRWALAGVALGLLLFLLPNLQSGQGVAEVAVSDIVETRVSQPSFRVVTVSPPAYTGRGAFTSEDLNLEVPEGSTLDWTFDYAGEDTLLMIMSDGASTERVTPFTAVEEGLVAGRAAVRTTSLYRFELRGRSGAAALSGVHTITVLLDAAPIVRVLAPEATVVEIPLGGDTTVDYEVSVRDDYGVTDAKIYASVAKGSGEGVKFRDEVFAFDSREVIDNSIRYRRTWQLESLGMEPGDEVYLFTRAYDNAPDAPHEGRSDTLIVRWLDEAKPAVAGDSLAIDLMPEYFKSQRQIIIDTERLIADRDALSEAEFVAASRALGDDQAALKERYGQYLGDEFGESEAPEGLLPDDAVLGDDDDHEDHDHDHEHEAGDDHEGHDHSAADTSGDAAALMARFGHVHGAADIGPITAQNPVGLMRRAVANMWDAELRLRLADPEGALPFERDALRYFDLARQADRIYTRRLGFEPPPVSEDRRLTGDLEDVRSRKRSVAANPDPSTARLMQALYLLLTTHPLDAPFSEADREMLGRAVSALNAAATERPVLIRAAAALESLRVTGRYAVGDCSDCRFEILDAAWSLLPSPEPGPTTHRRALTDRAGGVDLPPTTQVDGG